MAKEPRDDRPEIELPPEPPFEPDPQLITYMERGAKPPPTKEQRPPSPEPSRRSD